MDPNYLAAVLSHPGWRLLTAALAAGKRQDNLSQEQLVDVHIPVVGGDAQDGIARRYEDALRRIEEIYRSEEDFAKVCDEVLSGCAGLTLSSSARNQVQQARIALADVAETRGLRLDNRWHGPENSAVRSSLSAIPIRRLGSLLMSGPSKGRQPTWTAEEDADDDTPRAIATATIQAGTINWENAKLTTERSVSLFPITDGDLLVAMDGDGSLGKAAVYRGDLPATVDSHISRSRVRGGEDTADALSCYLNSTWGKVQTTSLMTGATGQTQLSATDLRDVAIPVAVIDRATVIAAAYREALRQYEPIVRRARRVICEASADLTRRLLAEGVLRSSENVAKFEDPSYLLSTFDLLYTRAWR
ncbi:hypothetical protein ACIA3K_27780 [Micromonospora sp. NPDC051543]|uniref:hypothetical protein n=1 Tax=Micromonospora sp. NPDC051543 TaxID=3364287 RepID=UPI0037ADD4F8